MKVEVEAALNIKDVGFVREGLAEAMVKLETFPYARCGMLPATVTTTITHAGAVNDDKR